MEKLSKTMQKRYVALEQRVTDIFNGACGVGMDINEWNDNWATPAQTVNIMRAVDGVWGNALKKLMYDGFELKFWHCEYFEQPKQATEWLWIVGIRK